MKEIFSIIKVTSVKELESSKKLFQEYDNFLRSIVDVSLEHQNFHLELENLPGPYLEPNGIILLIEYKNEFIACGALKKLIDKTAEIKRMFIKKDFRGKGLGKKLLEALIIEAKTKKYNFVRLDTLENLTAANKLYKSCGFYSIANYNRNPLKGACHFELKL